MRHLDRWPGRSRDEAERCWQHVAGYDGVTIQRVTADETQLAVPQSVDFDRPRVAIDHK
jgi:hypothetical protein